MQVRDITIPNNVDYIQNVYDTFRHLNILLKIFSINCNVHSRTVLNKSYTIIKYVMTTVILGSINFYTLYYKIRSIYSQINYSIKFTESVQMVYDFCQYIVDLSFVYKYGRSMSVEYFKQYGYIDKILGVAYYSTITARLLKLIAFFIIFWLVSSLCDFTAWVISFGWVIPLLYAEAYVYLLIKILTTLDLSAHAMHIECRMQSICDLLLDCYRVTDSLPDTMTDYIQSKHWLYSDACSRILYLQSRPDAGKKASCGSEHEVKWLTRCYLMLIEQTAYVNQMFGIRILLNCVSLIIDMIRFTNLTVRMLIGSQRTVYASGHFPAIATIIRLLMCVAVLVSLVHHCELVYRQRERALTLIDHMLINKNPSEKLRGAAIELRDLIQSKPIYFNMANFFRLTYSLLISIGSAVVTYTIIILQSMN